ncbi:MAG: hypothetical protein EOO38_19655, partial [Cytophagaceae bacterium]
MDLVVMAFFNSLVAFSILRFTFTIDARRHALFLLVLIPFGSFAYMVFIPKLLLGALAAMLGTTVGGLVYMAGTLYPKSDLDVKSGKTLASVNSILLVTISLISVYVYPDAKMAEPIQKLFGDIGFDVVVGSILLLSAANVFANIASLKIGKADEIS